MFNPKYLVYLDKRVFFSDQVVCLGSQLKSVVNNLNDLIEPHIWFCADIDAFSPVTKKLEINSFYLKKIGDDVSLISLCENIDQFLSGVFIAIKKRTQNINCFDLCIGTEDEQFRSLDLGGVLIEIRTFDTSYFEIYSENKDLMKKLSKKYDVEIEENGGV